MTDDTKKRKLEAALSAARATVALLEAELEEPQVPGISATDLLNVEQTQDQYNYGRDALLNAAKNGLQLVRCARNRIMVERAEIERWIKARPVTPRTRKAAPAANLDDWDRAAERALGGRQ